MGFSYPNLPIKESRWRCDSLAPWFNCRWPVCVARLNGSPASKCRPCPSTRPISLSGMLSTRSADTPSCYGILGGVCTSALSVLLLLTVFSAAEMSSSFLHMSPIPEKRDTLSNHRADHARHACVTCRRWSQSPKKNPPRPALMQGLGR